MIKYHHAKIAGYHDLPEEETVPNTVSNIDKACRWIDQNRDDLIEFLQKIIRIPSVTGDEGPIQDYLNGYLKEMGVERDMFVPNLDELRKHPAYVKEAQPYHGRPNIVATIKNQAFLSERGAGIVFTMNIEESFLLNS